MLVCRTAVPIIDYQVNSMKNTLSALLLGITLVSYSLLSHGDNGIHYNYGELRFVADSELDQFDVDGDGLALGGSLRLDEVFYVTLDYETIDYDNNIDTTTFQAALGLIYPIQKFDGIAELAIVNSDIDAPNGDSNTGFRITAGARTYVIPKLEVRGTVNYVDVDETDSYMTVAADYFVTPLFSVNASKDIAADVDRFSIGVRYYFGE